MEKEAAPVRVHLYIKERDYDLLLLSKTRRLKEAIRQGVHKYVTDDPLIMMPLPEYQKVKPEVKRPAIYFNPNEDSEVIDFVATIPRGNLNAVLQLLIRNVLRQADIRQLMDTGSTRSDVSRMKKERKSAPANPAQKPVRKKPASPQKFTPEPAGFLYEDNEDDIFAEI